MDWKFAEVRLLTSAATACRVFVRRMKYPGQVGLSRDILTLTPEQEKFIAERMSRGDYSSPEKVLDEGLKLIQAKEEYQRRLAELRRDLQVGLDQIQRGEVVRVLHGARDIPELFGSD